ncbi:TonB-dependent receptor [Aquimonas voraii]|uniref:Outer membrane receptor proteins, mostly Fe transport n=1 Tax=Aquimonas voraii TaxID=265719 RepID=A0A1G6YN48_9GAMM|nr:TonB-dependent receptor [Aquimonas voraii]SDD91750.1 Outer membrane receptor proteins, mostly Fe transport [Aquimonas voraii]
MILTTTRVGTRRTALSLALGLCLISGTALAQSTQGSIFGEASKGATIRIENLDTAAVREAKAGDNGRFSVGNLPSGRYQITADGVTRTVVVSAGSGSRVSLVGDATETSLEAIEVTASAINPIDVSSVESNTILSEAVIDRVPVGRNLTSVALLAPGTTQGDGAFGNLASFGGASVGENAYYINGFNVTNFRNGLGGSTVPFEFYREFQVKTGGYGAEFGRSTGGVISATTKRGTNEWAFGGNLYWEPESLTSTARDTFFADGEIYTFNSRDESSFLTANAYVSGPLIKDRLFFFLLGQSRNLDSDFYGVGSFTRRASDDPFWGAKLDWYITDNHLLEYTGFSDRADTVDTAFLYAYPDPDIGERRSATTLERGGRNDILKYTGYLSDTFTLSLLWGRGEANRSDVGEGDDCPVILDRRAGGSSIPRGCYSSQLPGTAVDDREAWRADVEWSLADGRHVLRFGVDNEINTSADNVAYSGGVLWQYLQSSRSPTGFELRQRFYSNGGSFETEASAFYLEDAWQVTDRVLLSLGIRNEAFDNRNANGETFTKLDNQWAPRFGLAWDIQGDGSQKFFANAGRYHLPVANNTNIRLAGAEFFTEQFLVLNGVNADFTPIIGAPLTDVSVFADGEIKDPREIVNQDLKPMYQDEFILGYQREIWNDWTLGVRGIYRDLKSTLEDVAVDAALNAYAAANGFADFEAGGFDYYVLTNPGRDIRMGVDLDGDGSLEEVLLTADALGYPDSTRTYKAVELFWEKSWNDVWFLQGSWTLSKSEGNNEGYVRSDNGQDDAGLTTLFDQPGLLDGASGYLPNDRRHKLKLFGAWKFASEWTASSNLQFQSGRPINCFGVHPTDEFAAEYGAESFYCGGQLRPRGSGGRTPSTYTVDLGLEYRPGWASERLAIKLDVFNILNSQKTLEVNELGEDDNGDPNPAYLLPTLYQDPRAVRFAISYDW